MLHPSAIIDPQAELDDDVSVGPFSVIGPKVHIASGTQIGPHVVIKGETHIGRDNKIYQFASVGEDPQDRKYVGGLSRLVIGDRNHIRESCTIHRGTEQDDGVTRIGDDNLLMAYTHVAHDCQIGSHTVMANAASLGGHVRLDDWVILGGFAMVRQFCHLGAHSFAAMGASIRKDVLPYLLVEGAPAVLRGVNQEGLARRAFSVTDINVIKQAYKLLSRSGILLPEIIQKLASEAEKQPILQPMVDFLQSNRRGCSVLR
jgi:UDP-N-acetylglucosamine acyltransferase